MLSKLEIEHCTVNIFGSKSGHLGKHIISNDWKIFLRFPIFFAVFDDFLKWRVLQLGKIINYGKNLGEMKKTMQFLLLLFKWPLLGPKMFIVYCDVE